jgi:hypothetical protein
VGREALPTLPLTDPLCLPAVSSGRDRRRRSWSSALPEWAFCPYGMWQPLTLARRTRSLDLNLAPSALAAES